MGLRHLFVKFGHKFGADATLSRAAALAYYTTLSVAPFSILSLLLLSLIDADLVSGYSAEVERFLGTEAGQIFATVVGSVKSRPDLGTVAGLASVVMLFWSAGAVFGELRQTLNRIYHIKEDDEERTWAQAIAHLVHEKVFNAGLVLGFIFILMTSLVLSSIVNFFSEAVPPGLSILINWAGSGAVYIATFSLLFRYVPSKRLPWMEAVRGAVMASLFFLVGKEVISRYLGTSSWAGAYGAAGSLVVFLLWIYYSAIILFASAQLNVVWMKARRPKIPSERGTSPRPSISMLVSRRLCDLAHVRVLHLSGARAKKEDLMLRAAIVFFVLGLIAILFGATGFAGLSIEIGRTLLIVFLILAAISFVASLISGRRTTYLP